jgi:hypothetical protein
LPSSPSDYTDRHVERNPTPTYRTGVQCPQKLPSPFAIWEDFEKAPRVLCSNLGALCARVRA